MLRGILVRLSNLYSKIAKKLRIELDNIMARENRDISGIEEYFSSEMKDKAWWFE